MVSTILNAVIISLIYITNILVSNYYKDFTRFTSMIILFSYLIIGRIAGIFLETNSFNLISLDVKIICLVILVCSNIIYKEIKKNKDNKNYE